MSLIKKSLLLLTTLLLVVQYGYGQRPPSEKIAAAFTQFQREAGLSNNQAAFAVMDGKSTDPIFEHLGKTGMATASTLKVITSITAMDLLGVDFDYQTILGYTGSIDQSGVLHGDLIIKGSGDPTLGSDRYANTKPKNILDNWTFALIKLGIKRITGRVIGDDLIFGGNQVPTGWPAGDIGNYYGAGISGLNWKENKAGITFSPAAVGQAAAIAKLTDDLSYLTIRNEVRTGNPGSGDKVYGYSSPYAQTVHLKGTYGKDLRKTIEISVPDPAYQLARDLKINMELEGIMVEGIATSAFKLTDYRKETLRTVATHHSPKLPQILHWFNHKSINLYGEALLKSIGKEKNNVHSTAAAADYLSAYWHKTLGIPRAELGILDGCGLSPDNRVSAQAMTQIMRYAKSQPWYAEFYKSLPTINQMKMKSGTIGGVLGYAGYQRAADGQELSFTLFVNNYKGSAAQMRQRMFKLLNVLKQ